MQVYGAEVPGVQWPSAPSARHATPSADLARLDTELRDATFSLQQCRNSYAQEVARHEMARATRSAEISAALHELEASSAEMHFCLEELAAERSAVAELEAECSSLEQRVDSLHDVKQPEIARHVAVPGSERSDEEDAEMSLSAARALLRSSMQSLAKEALALGSATAGRAARRTEHTACRLAALRVLVAMAMRHGRSERAWRGLQGGQLEVQGLLDSLGEASRLANLQAEIRSQPQSRAGDEAGKAALAKVASLRSEVATELHEAVAAVASEHFHWRDG